MLAYPKIGPQYAVKRNDRAIESNNSFWLFCSWKAEYLGRKKTCSMICGAIVDKGCNVAQSVIQSCHQAACLGKTGEKRYPSINIKPLSTMISLVMKHFFSLAKVIHALLYFCSDMNPLYEHTEYFYWMFCLLQTADERIFWYSRILQTLYNTSGYRRNLKKKRNWAA